MRASWLLLLLAACGSRSGLDEPIFVVGGSGGAGGSAGTGGSPAGAGGMLEFCPGLFVSGDPIASTTPPGVEGEEERPSLIAVDASRVVVPYRVASEFAIAGPVRAATFDAWGNWPADLGPGHDVTPFDYPAYLATRGRGAADFAVLTGTPALGGNEGGAFCDLVPTVEAATSYPGGGAPSQFLSTLAPGRGAAISASPVGFHVGWVMGSGSIFYLQQTDVDPPAQEAFPSMASGCATSRLKASFLGLSDGHLAAFSTGRAWGACPLDDGVIGPPTRVQVERWSGGTPTLGHELVGLDPMQNVALVPRPGGAWLVWQEDGASAETVPAVWGVPLDQVGSPVGEPIVLVEDGVVFSALGASAMGSGFVVAWVDAIDPSAPTIRVRAFEANGDLRAEGELYTGGAFLLEQGVVVLGSGEGNDLLLGWRADVGEPGSKVVVARMSCFAD